MEKRKKSLIIGILILILWMILIMGFIRVPAFVWLLLALITFIYYLAVTRYSYRRESSLQNVIEELETHMDKKAEEELGKDEEEEESEEEEHEFGDDIKIIKE